MTNPHHLPDVSADFVRLFVLIGAHFQDIAGLLFVGFVGNLNRVTPIKSSYEKHIVRMLPRLLNAALVIGGSELLNGILGAAFHVLGALGEKGDGVKERV